MEVNVKQSKKELNKQTHKVLKELEKYIENIYQYVVVGVYIEIINIRKHFLQELFKIFLRNISSAYNKMHSKHF